MIQYKLPLWPDKIKTLRNALICIAFICNIPVNCQISFQEDTIKIKEVVITRKKFSSELQGYKKKTIDSTILRNYSNGTLAEVLSEHSGIFIKSYGMGGSATPTLRGTGASQTQIAWNGINFNNPMLGQSDLSLLPAGLIDDIQILYGGASMPMNNGGLGGIINLETKPVWKKETVISLNPTMGSFGRYTGFLTVKSGNILFQSVTKAFYQSAENDFRYLNTESGAVPVWETRKNSQFSQNGFLQEFYSLRSKNIVSARLWYLSAKRNLASSLLTQQSGSAESQMDESLRATLTYDIDKESSKYSITGAWLFDKLNYSDPHASINSKNISDMFILKAGTEILAGEGTKLKFVVSEDINIIKSNNYAQTPTRNTTSATAFAEQRISDRFGASILVREILDKNKLLVPDFSAALQFRMAESKDYFLKANVSRNSKIPTMNDLFWVPGGNPQLRNEYAFMYEVMCEMNQKTLPGLTFSSNLSAFRNSIKDMIQWKPGQNSIWTAENVQNVNTMGLEYSFSINYKKNNLTTGFNADYSLTKAVEGGSAGNDYKSTGNQLMYIPENLLNLSFRLGYKKFYSSFLVNMTGKRYITVDNTKYLPGYCINSFTTGVRLKLKRTLFDLNVDIDNLFNVNYQTIAYYPLPGRFYSLKLLVQIFK
jgi:outer membrane cobalamin receptor